MLGLSHTTCFHKNLSTPKIEINIRLILYFPEKQYDNLKMKNNLCYRIETQYQK